MHHYETSIYIFFLLKEIAASALLIFFDRDSTLLTILGGSWKITWPKLTFGVVATFRSSWIIFGRSLMIHWIYIFKYDYNFWYNQIDNSVLWRQSLFFIFAKSRILIDSMKIHKFHSTSRRASQMVLLQCILLTRDCPPCSLPPLISFYFHNIKKKVFPPGRLN
jgi:hypothetical protein